MTSTVALLRPQRLTLGAQTAEILRASILRGELKPGQKLVERELAEQLGISQGSVRQGLHDLEHEGLVTKKTNTATYVTELTRQQVTDIVEVRVELEPIAFLLARRRMKPGQFEELETLALEIAAEVSENDYYQVSQRDFRFHRRVWQMSGNATLEKTLTQLCTPLFAYLMIFLSSSRSDLKQRVKSHRLLIGALRAGEERRIRDAVSEHVRNAWFQFLD